jgi:hypothetical protein
MVSIAMQTKVTGEQTGMTLVCVAMARNHLDRQT